MYTRPVIFALALLLCPPFAAAQQTDIPPASGGENGDSADERRAKLLDVVSIVGKGETRQIQRLGQIETQRVPAGSSPLKILARLPGVHFQSADPWGNYEWSTRLSIRGFQQNQLGFVLDRVPLGDMSYGNSNGLHVSRAMIVENLQTMELAQGSGALDTASTGNLGGTVRVLSADPAPDYGVRIAQTLGSSSTQRTFARLDTGDLAGTRSFLSYMYHDADKWKGDGPQRYRQFNGKLVHDFDTARLTGYVATSRRIERDYQDLSLDSQRRHGWGWDYFAPDWQRAIEAANTLCGADGIHAYSYLCDDAYYLGRGLRDDNLAYLTHDWSPSEFWSLVSTAYYHNDEGQGHWITPYTPSANVPLSLRTSEYDIERSGILPTLTVYAGNHVIEAGFWYENNVHGLQRNFYELDVNEPPDAEVFYRDPRSRVFHQRFDVNTLQYFIQDRIELLDTRLALEIGFKGTEVDMDALNIIGSRASGTLSSVDHFQPQVGARYRFSDADEMFASYAENMAAFVPGTTGPFSASQSSFDDFSPGLRPESSRTLEGGWRTVRDNLQALVAIYHVTFDDRLLGIARCAGIVGCPRGFANVGSVSTRGAEAGLMLKPLPGLEWYSSLSYNDSKYDDDYLDGQNLIASGGKQVVDAPKKLFSTNLTWHSGAWSAALGAKFTDKRYYTYLNDSQVPSFWVADASLGYQVENWGPAKLVRFQINTTNLFDKRYFATLGTNGFVASDPQGVFTTLLEGPPRQVFLSVDVTF